jgi:hypothetical protein
MLGGVGPSRTEGGVDGLLRKVVPCDALTFPSCVGGTGTNEKDVIGQPIDS